MLSFVESDCHYVLIEHFSHNLSVQKLLDNVRFRFHLVRAHLLIIFELSSCELSSCELSSLTTFMTVSIPYLHGWLCVLKLTVSTNLGF